MFWGAFRKTIGLFLLAFGVGAAISILLPVWCWVAIVAIALVALGISWLFCQEVNKMKVVVYKPGKFMKLVLKTIFKI